MDCLDYELYVMVQSPKHCFYILYMILQLCVLDPYDRDQFIFMGEKVIFITYTNGCLLISESYKYICDLVDKMCDQKFELKYED